MGKNDDKLPSKEISHPSQLGKGIPEKKISDIANEIRFLCHNCY